MLTLHFNISYVKLFARHLKSKIRGSKPCDIAYEEIALVPELIALLTK